MSYLLFIEILVDSFVEYFPQDSVMDVLLEVEGTILFSVTTDVLSARINEKDAFIVLSHKYTIIIIMIKIKIKIIIIIIIIIIIVLRQIYFFFSRDNVLSPGHPRCSRLSIVAYVLQIITAFPGIVANVLHRSTAFPGIVAYVLHRITASPGIVANVLHRITASPGIVVHLLHIPRFCSLDDGCRFHSTKTFNLLMFFVRPSVLPSVRPSRFRNNQ